MLYDSSKHGLVEISDMPVPHIKNALAKLERTLRKSYNDHQVIGALKQALVEKERNPSTEELKKQLNQMQESLAEVKGFHLQLREVVNKY